MYIKIVMYENGTQTVYHIPKRYGKLLEELPFHEVMRIIKEDREKEKAEHNKTT
jgi:hypothetical protein